jgi:hypothetical protein
VGNRKDLLRWPRGGSTEISAKSSSRDFEDQVAEPKHAAAAGEGMGRGVVRPFLTILIVDRPLSSTPNGAGRDALQAPAVASDDHAVAGEDALAFG